jgi:hypothetical protein
LLPKKRSEAMFKKKIKIYLTFPATSCKLRPQADWVTPLNPVGLLFFEGFMYVTQLCFQAG